MNISTTYSPYSISQSLARMELNKAEELQNNMSEQFWSMIGTANQCAYVAMDEAVEAMKAAGLYRQQVKRDAQRAIEEYHKYEKLCIEWFKGYKDDRYYLWQDLIGKATEKLEPDVTRLYYAVKNKIDSYKVPNAIALAKVQTAMAMISLANLLFDEMVTKYQKQTPIRISDKFKAWRLTGCESFWRVVGYLTGTQVMANIDLSKDENCQLGIRVILQRYETAAFLNIAAKEALELNPTIR